MWFREAGLGRKNSCPATGPLGNKKLVVGKLLKREIGMGGTLRFVRAITNPPSLKYLEYERGKVKRSDGKKENEGI